MWNNLLAIIVLQVPQVIQHALLQNQLTPHLLQCPFHHQFLVAQQLPVSMVCWLGQALKMSNKLNAARSVMPSKCQICWFWCPDPKHLSPGWPHPINKTCSFPKPGPHHLFTNPGFHMPPTLHILLLSSQTISENFHVPTPPQDQ
jgi:hypothetical protein